MNGYFTLPPTGLWWLAEVEKLWSFTASKILDASHII